jgi:hypothetical protein
MRWVQFYAIGIDVECRIDGKNWEPCRVTGHTRTRLPIVSALCRASGGLEFRIGRARDIRSPVVLGGKERHVMAHAVGWSSKEPLFRNHFVASDGHDDWPTLQQLCAKKLMRVSRLASDLSGGDTVFCVTDHGVAALGRWT